MGSRETLAIVGCAELSGEPAPADALHSRVPFTILSRMADDLISFYDYELPPELIARAPTADRSESRLLVVDRSAQEIHQLAFRDFPSLLHPGDLLVVNDTRVVPARLQGFRTSTRGRWEGLFLRTDENSSWRIIGHCRGRLQPGESLTIPHPHNSQETPLLLQLIQFTGSEWICRPNSPLTAWEILDRYGDVPLPPYLERESQPEDRERYQTIYASAPGAVAAPTAGLHFTPEILEACLARGVRTASVTLHVGLGTFRPVSVDRLEDHPMHSEWREVPAGTVELVQHARATGGRVVCVGTTTVRSLESAAASGQLVAGSAETNLFIRPPFNFQVTDALLTNFHLPRSTLLVLVSTLAGRELILRAYQEAVRERYRFFSYGDAMLIV